MMDLLLQNKIIGHIQELWKKHNSSNELDGIWLALHEPMNLNYNELDTVVIRAWFIKNNSAEEKKPIDYKVFRDLGFKSEKTYTIAFANTALIKQSDLLYIGCQLGGLLGRGMLFKINIDGDFDYIKDLWVS